MNKIRSYSLNDILAYCLLAICAFVFLFFIIFNANWFLGDQLQFLRTTALGKILPIENYIIPSLGRFFPLGLMDYNLLMLFTNGNTVTAHFILNAFSFIIFVFVTTALLYKIISSESRSVLNSWIIVFTMLFLSQRVFSVFLDIIFPERIIVTLLAVFMLSTWLFYNTDKWVYGITSLLCAAYLVYCKEPLFGALLVFALTNLLFNNKNLSRNNRIFQWLLVFNSFIFIILYYFLVYRNIESAYGGSHGESNWIDITLRMIWSHKIVFVAIFIFLIRIYTVIIKKEKKHLFYDALLFSGLAYFGACLILQLNFTYYYLPAVIMFTPSVVYWLIYYIKPLATFSIMAFFALFYLVKAPTQITDNQQIRITTYPIVKQIADYVPEGYQLIWYENNPKDSSYNSILLEWKRASLQTYIAYILKDEKFELVKTNSILKIVNSKTLVLYPVENDLIDKESIIKFANETQYLSKDTIAQISDITVMKLYQ